MKQCATRKMEDSLKRLIIELFMMVRAIEDDRLHHSPNPFVPDTSAAPAAAVKYNSQLVYNANKAVKKLIDSRSY